MSVSPEQLQQIIEAALMVAGSPLTIRQLQHLFAEGEQPSSADIKTILVTLMERYHQSGLELRELASGYQLQAKAELSPWLSKLWEEKPQRYSKALLETLALIAYRQPITRAEIEDVRGVTISSPIIKTLMEREWIQVVGQRDVPGKPSLYGTTKTFLDTFNLTHLDELPTLAEIHDLDRQEAQLQVQLEFANTEIPANSPDEEITTSTHE